jgi:hypothetical protein
MALLKQCRMNLVSRTGCKYFEESSKRRPKLSIDIKHTFKMLKGNVP